MKKALVLAVAASLATGIAACGSSGSSSSTPSSAAGASTGGGAGKSQTLKLSADPNGAFKFSTDKLSAKTGQVTIDFTNPASLQHDVELTTKDGRQIAVTSLVSGGKSASLSANLQAGTYTYFCNVPGHRDGGMQGTLTVK